MRFLLVCGILALATVASADDGFCSDVIDSECDIASGSSRKYLFSYFFY